MEWMVWWWLKATRNTFQFTRFSKYRQKKLLRALLQTKQENIKSLCEAKNGNWSNSIPSLSYHHHHVGVEETSWKKKKNIQYSLNESELWLIFKGERGKKFNEAKYKFSSPFHISLRRRFYVCFIFVWKRLWNPHTMPRENNFFFEMWNVNFYSFLVIEQENWGVGEREEWRKCVKSGKLLW